MIFVRQQLISIDYNFYFTDPKLKREISTSILFEKLCIELIRACYVREKINVVKMRVISRGSMYANNAIFFGVFKLVTT